MMGLILPQLMGAKAQVFSVLFKVTSGIAIQSIRIKDYFLINWE